MKIIRIILSLLVLLAAIVSGMLAYFIFTNEKLSGAKIDLSRFFPGLVEQFAFLDVSLPLPETSVGVAVVLLLVSGMLWPKRSYGYKTPRERAKEAKKNLKKVKKAAAHGASASSALDAVPASAGPPADLPPADIAQYESELDAEDAGQSPKSDDGMDDEMLRTLVNKEQQKLDRDSAMEVITMAYPQVAKSCDFHDDEVLAVLARQIIAILRIRIKVKDKSLASYQFAQFQEKIYKLEDEKIFYKYEPSGGASLSDEQRSMSGKIFSLNGYREVQQRIGAARDNWKQLSLKDLV